MTGLRCMNCEFPLRSSLPQWVGYLFVLTPAQIPLPQPLRFIWRGLSEWRHVHHAEVDLKV
jgi:hypothetical protein